MRGIPMSQKKPCPPDNPSDYLFIAGHSWSWSLGHRFQFPPGPLTWVPSPSPCQGHSNFLLLFPYHHQDARGCLRPHVWAQLSDFPDARMDAEKACSFPRWGSKNKGLGPFLLWISSCLPYLDSARVRSRARHKLPLLLSLLFEFCSPSQEKSFILFLCGWKWALHPSFPCLLFEDKPGVFLLALTLDN